jgi:hypothetical protein
MAAGSALIWAVSRMHVATGATAAQAPSLDLKAEARSSALALQSFTRLPMLFEPNVGQSDPQVKFLARGNGYGLFLTGNEAVLSLSRTKADKSAERELVTPLRMRLAGASASASVTGDQPLPGKSNYFIGNDPKQWHTGVPQFARVRYESVYPGVDLVYYGNQGQLEYDFEVAPGRDPKRVQLEFQGARKLHLDGGDLVVATAAGDIRFLAPVVYQNVGSSRQTVAARFELLADNRVGFAIGNYDATRTLVIDPVLTYSTYLGGGGESSPKVAVDAAFNLYIAGTTTSPSFPVTSSAFQSTLKGAANVFIAKLDPTGTQVLYATYLGGTGTDALAGVAVDAASNIYVTGSTTSSDFPTSGSTAPFQASPKAPGTHAFVTEISPGATQQLVYSTYLSGSGTDTASGIAINPLNQIYVIGITNSTDFPTAPPQGPFQVNLPGPIAFFVSKIDITQTPTLVYSTYFGGTSPSNGTVTGGAIAVDNNTTESNIFITGGTNFTDFPLLQASQSCLNNPTSTGQCPSQTTANGDAFVAKLNPKPATGAQLIYSTFVGGSGNEVGYGIGLDQAGNAYIAGSSNSTETASTIAPKLGSVQPYQPANGGGANDAFVAKVSNPVAGCSLCNVQLSYFSYLGGSGNDVANALAVDSVQGALITGITNSANLVTTPNAIQSTLKGTTNAFVARLDTTSTTAPPTIPSGVFVTYLGGSRMDSGTGIAVDGNSVPYIVGQTTSSDFPTRTPIQGLKGTQNAFAAKLGPIPNLSVTFNGNTTTPVNTGNPATFTYTIKNSGDTVAGVAFVDNLANSGVIANFVSATATGGSCPSQPTNNTIICNIGVLNSGASTQVSITLNATSVGTLANSGCVIIAGSPFTACANGSFAVNSYALLVAPASQTVTAGNSTTFTPTLTPQGSKGTYSANISLGCPSGLPNGASCSFSSSSVTLENQSGTSVTLTISTTARTSTTGAIFKSGPFYAMLLPITGLALAGVGMRRTRKRTLGVLGLLALAALLAVQPACSHSGSTTINTGTPPGTYAITISASSGTFNQSQQIQLVVQ